MKQISPSTTVVLLRQLKRPKIPEKRRKVKAADSKQSLQNLLLGQLVKLLVSMETPIYYNKIFKHLEDCRQSALCQDQISSEPINQSTTRLPES
eukprot:1065117-Amphidinium_carterae.1